MKIGKLKIKFGDPGYKGQKNGGAICSQNKMKQNKTKQNETKQNKIKWNTIK